MERPVYYDNIIEKVVEVPVEKVVYNRVETVVEEPEYLTNVIEKPVPVQRFVEVPFDEVVEEIVERPVVVENIVHKPREVIREVEKQMFNDVRVNVPRYIEKPRIRENIITREIPKIVQQEVIYEQQVPVEKST